MDIKSDLINKKGGLKKIFGLYIAPLVFLYITLFVDLEPGKPEITFTLAIALLMAFWWITETIPIAITALLPIVLFPLFGVMDGKTVSSAYFNHVIFLFIGGFIVALAMQKWNLHQRIALKILSLTGSSPAKILFGFMFSAAFLSMWISNTATAMMMVPILLSIISKLQEYFDPSDLKRYSIGLLLGVAYGSSIGGIATLVGTPPNLSFARIFQIMFPDAPEISFSAWFIFAAPISIIFFIITWLYLHHRFKPKKLITDLIGINFGDEYRKLGPSSQEEKSVFIVFVSLALLWLTRKGLAIGSFQIPGWSQLLKTPEFINDGTVAIALALVLYFIPSKQRKGEKIMDWESSAKLPWNIILLFGGGFALASGFKESGLSFWFGEQLSAAETLHPLLLIGIIAIFMTFLTELTSNTATIEMLLPVLAGLAVSININPLILMLPATISASMAFMLPVATPPNAIIFASNRIRIRDMARTGLVLNLIGVIVVTLVSYFWGTWVFDFDPSQLPTWAE
jgi:sodium-dependent dicarboxylate transporter 2/3/5